MDILISTINYGLLILLWIVCSNLLDKVTKLEKEVKKLNTDLDKLYQVQNREANAREKYVELFTQTRTEFNKIKMMLLTHKEKE